MSVLDTSARERNDPWEYDEVATGAAAFIQAEWPEAVPPYLVNEELVAVTGLLNGTHHQTSEEEELRFGIVTARDYGTNIRWLMLADALKALRGSRVDPNTAGNWAY